MGRLCCRTILSAMADASSLSASPVSCGCSLSACSCAFVIAESSASLSSIRSPSSFRPWNRSFAL